MFIETNAVSPVPRYEDVTIHPQKTVALLSPAERFLFPFTNVVLFLLSCVWFAAITRGFLKMLGKTAGDAFDESPAEIINEKKEKPN
eukprot:6664862-Pyramimonas_sp.AAC.2